MNIRIEGLTKKFGDEVTALDQVQLHIEHGMYGLLGPNGAGKSTLMQTLATLLSPTSGEVYYGDYKLGRDDHEIRRLIGYLPQAFGLYEKLTGEEFLDYIALLKGIKHGEERKRLVASMLERVNLAHKKNQRIHTYSGGMKQRVGIAQALIGDPKVIIVDEPTAGLDPEERIRFRNILEDLSLERIVLLSTHIVSDIESSCNKLAVMNRGKVLFEGSPEQMLELIEGKVWTGILPSEHWFYTQNNGVCVSKRKTKQGLEVRMISDELPFADAVPAEANLEDGYMALTGGMPSE